MPTTLLDMRLRIRRWAREPFEDEMVDDAVNDAVQDIWSALFRARMQMFVRMAVIPAPSESGVEAVASVADPSEPLEAASSPASNPSGDVAVARTYRLYYTLATESGSETLPSPAKELELEAGEAAVAEPPARDPEAYGWNLYAASSLHDIGVPALQNIEPVPFGESLPEPGYGWDFSAGRTGVPARNTTGDGVMAVTGVRQGGIDLRPAEVFSLAFRRKARLHPANGGVPVWDVVGSGELVYSPTPMSSALREAFYVKRPRRIRFPGAQLPFQGLDADKAIASSALADLLASVGEGGAAQWWKNEAAEQLASILQNAIRQSQVSNGQVTPFKA